MQLRSNRIDVQLSGCASHVPPLAARSHEYSCPGVSSIVADLGDGDDWFGGIRTGVPMSVRGGARDDTLGGDDLTAAVASPDVLDGGPGDDELAAGRGDTVRGGTGVDTVTTMLESRGSVSLSLEGVGGGAATVFPDVENAAPGHSGPVVLTGTGAANELTGGDSDDRLVGGRAAQARAAVIDETQEWCLSTALNLCRPRASSRPGGGSNRRDVDYLVKHA